MPAIALVYWPLQDGGELARQKLGHEDHRAVRKFKRVMMRMFDANIDLPEARNTSRRHLRSKQKPFAVLRRCLEG